MRSPDFSKGSMNHFMRLGIVSMIYLEHVHTMDSQNCINFAHSIMLLDKMPRECLKIIESKSKVRQTRAKEVVAKVSTNSSTQAVSSDVAELKDIVRALLLDKKNQASASAPAHAPVKAVELSCVTCGGAHSHQNCLISA
ncbi:hypothetical protein Tco_0346082 [Tanacetum coccineum]